MFKGTPGIQDPSTPLRTHQYPSGHVIIPQGEIVRIIFMFSSDMKKSLLAVRTLKGPSGPIGTHQLAKSIIRILEEIVISYLYYPSSSSNHLLPLEKRENATVVAVFKIIGESGSSQAL